MLRRPFCLALPVMLGAAISLFAQDAIVQSNGGHGCFVDLLRRAAWGLSGRFERAAFVVQEPGGAFDCVLWPSKHMDMEESFHGLMPAGTVALVHTHPAEYPLPSEHDIEEAARVRKPIYVISIRGIYRADPRNHSVLVLARGRSWIYRLPEAVISAAASP